MCISELTTDSPPVLHLGGKTGLIWSDADFIAVLTNWTCKFCFPRVFAFLTSFLSREPVDEVLQMPPSLLTCGGCQQSIGDRFFLKAIEQYWHEDCLSCDLCGCRLGEVGRRLYYKLGRKLCRRDYLRLVCVIQDIRIWSVKVFLLSVLLLMSSSGFLVRTVSALPARRGSGRLRWRCAFGTKFTTWSASNVQPVRSTSAWGIATCSSTQTLCVSRTFLSGPNSTTTI